ncbi:MAG: YihY/virulence factor BrkB family protein [Acidobacteria bacterium]|nr:YihY/virulence factor BrkB family protein [Acidobacteriota bacterium]
MPIQRYSVVPEGVRDDAALTTPAKEPADGTDAAGDGAGTVKVPAGEEKICAGLEAADAEPVDQGGSWQQIVAFAGYMTKTEVHTYAFSVAAQVILSLFPFIVLLLTIAERIFHSPRLVGVVSQMVSNFLPSNQDFVLRNMRLLAFAHTKTRIFSVVMLLITTTGVFLPLEVALNSVWGVRKNRSYVRNQVVSLGLAAGVCVLAMMSIGLSASQAAVMRLMFFGHTQNIVFTVVGDSFLKICGALASVGIFFLIYWGLPNRKVPVRAVLPTAIVVGLLWEVAKYAYILALPYMDFRAIYGPFEVSVGLIVWGFISGLLLLAGAYVSATRHGLREARKGDVARAAEGKG